VNASGPEPVSTRLVAVGVDAVPLRWYRAVTAQQTRARATLLWLHGGGFFRGSIDQPEAHAVAEALARDGVTVATVGYRLAPPPGMPWATTNAGRARGRYPSQLDDVMHAYREIESRSPGGVVLGGASAGACLAAATALRAMDEGLRPVGAVLVYGFFHARHPRERDRRLRSRGHRRITHAPWALDLANMNYAGSPRALEERFAFPGGHSIGEFPRTLMIDAERDNMRASGELFASELRRASTDLDYRVLPGTQHAFLNRPHLQEFETAISTVSSWMSAAGLR
jgi:acetyl esterase/lipase